MDRLDHERTDKCQFCDKPTTKFAVFHKTESAMPMCDDHARVVEASAARIVAYSESEHVMVVDPATFDRDYAGEYSIDREM